MHNARPILLIEDDRIDAMTVERALKQMNVSNRLIHKTDPEQALDYLTDPENDKPALILMDLNTPKMNGIEFLKTIKADDNLRDIPVVAMSTSDAQEDRDQTAKLGAVKYIVKPVGYDTFLEELSTIDQLACQTSTT